MGGLQRFITSTPGEAVSEEVTLNLIADTRGTAMYESDAYWVLNDGNGACTSAGRTSCAFRPRISNHQKPSIYEEKNWLQKNLTLSGILL